MRIVDIRETAIPLKSNLSNSSFDFTEMTTSVVAVVTDVVRDGKPVCGFAFNSTGRYACGAAMRARFIPRILAAKPDMLLDEAGLLDPAKILACMMQREKAGGHSERSIAIGTIEVAVWDALAKIADQPLYRLLAERFNGGKVPDKRVLLRRRRLVLAGPDHPGFARRDAPPSRRRLHHGQDESRRPAARRRPAAAGSGAASGGLRRASRRRRQLQIRPRRGARLCQGARALQAALVRGAVRSARLRADGGARRRLCAAARDRRKPVLHGRRREPGALRRAGAPGTTSSRSTRRRPTASRNTRARSPCWKRRGWPRASLFPHGGNQMSLAIAAGFGLGGAESYPGVFGDFGGFADDARIENGAITLSERPGIGFEGQGRLYRIMRELAGL